MGLYLQPRVPQSERRVPQENSIKHKYYILSNIIKTVYLNNSHYFHHHHHKHQGLDHLIRSVSRVTAARANAISPVLPLEILSWVGFPQDDNQFLAEYVWWQLTSGPPNMPLFCRGVLPQPKVSVLRRRGLAFIRSSLLQPGMTIEDVRKSDLLAEMTHVLSDSVPQDLWLLSIGIDNNPWGPVPAFDVNTEV